MGEYITLLLSLVTNYQPNGLVKVSLTVKQSDIGDDCASYPLEPENLDKLYGLLPEHIKSFTIGIVDVEQLFDGVWPTPPKGLLPK